MHSTVILKKILKKSLDLWCKSQVSFYKGRKIAIWFIHIGDMRSGPQQEYISIGTNV